MQRTRHLRSRRLFPSSFKQFFARPEVLDHLECSLHLVSVALVGQFSEPGAESLVGVPEPLHLIETALQVKLSLAGSKFVPAIARLES